MGIAALLWTLSVARAEEPVPPEPAEPEEGETIAIPGGEDPLPSALDDPEPIHYPDEPEGIASLLDLWKEERRDVWGGSTYVKPVLSMLVGADVRPVQLGFALGRRWWRLEGLPGFTVQVEGNGDFALAGGAGSYELGLGALAGPSAWVVGLLVGPELGASRLALGDRELAATGGLDGVALLTLDAKVLHLFGGIAPRWLLSDARPGAPAEDHPLPGLGDELATRTGAGATLGPLRVSADWTRRWTAIGTIDRFGIGFRFRLL